MYKIPFLSNFLFSCFNLFSPTFVRLSETFLTEGKMRSTDLILHFTRIAHKGLMSTELYHGVSLKI